MKRKGKERQMEGRKEGKMGGRRTNKRISNQCSKVVKSLGLGVDFLGSTTVGLEVHIEPPCI